MKMMHHMRTHLEVIGVSSTMESQHLNGVSCEHVKMCCPFAFEDAFSCYNLLV